MTTSHLFRKDVLSAKAYVVPHVEDAVKLNQNESPWDLPIQLKVAITEKLIKTDFNRYPLAEPLQLKKKIAKHDKVLTDQIAVSNGSNVLIQAIVNATSLKPRGKVMVLDPTFVVYAHQAEVFGIPVVKVPLGENFALSHEAVIAAIRKEAPSVLFISNPNAPTGNLFAKESLYKIVKAAPCLTVIDEAYYPFSNESLVDWLADFPHLVILRTLSKAFALAGVRVGYAIGEPDVIAQIEKVMMPFCLSTIACVIAMEVLDHADFVAGYVKDVLKQRRKLFDEMQQIAGVTAFPSDTNFILFRSERAAEIVRELKTRGLLVRDVNDGNRLKDCLRVSVGTPEENQEFLKALKEIVT
jgi:histidinol-phosphate aminotransferase